MLDSGAPGGKLNVSAEIENWPGQKKKTGPELAYEMYEHALSSVSYTHLDVYKRQMLYLTRYN